MKWGSVEAMVRYLDRKEIAEARERRFRNAVRKFPLRQRKFILAVRRVVMLEKGPENLQAKKVMERLKIGPRRYYFLLKIVHKTPSKGAISGGAVKK